MQQSGAILKLSNFLKRLFKKRGHGIISDDLIKELETKFNYQFKDKNILIQALKHRSFLAVTGEARLFSNERLELLGDSVLGIIVTEHLFKKFPDKEEGADPGQDARLGDIPHSLGSADGALRNQPHAGPDQDGGEER